MRVWRCACVRCHAGKEQCFGIFHPDRKTYFLQAETEGEMMSWVKAVRTGKGKAKACHGPDPSTRVLCSVFSWSTRGT